jgi:hypothetical protein
MNESALAITEKHIGTSDVRVVLLQHIVELLEKIEENTRKV